MGVDGEADSNQHKQELQAPVGTNRMNKLALPQSVAPRIKVELYQDATGEWAPAEERKYDNNSLWKLDILRGSHTAITLTNAQNVQIHPNNPANAVPEDTAVWVDNNVSGSPRTIFFYGRFMPIVASEQRNDQNAIFTGTKLQVWVRQYPNNYVYIKLMGESLALNSCSRLEMQNGKIVIVPEKPILTPYDLKHNEPIPRTLSKQDVITRILANCPLDHLVFNCHGSRDPDDTIGGSIYIGDTGFNRSNLNLQHPDNYWEKLSGKVKYIWLMNCYVGGDNFLCASIARKTQAWVSAPELFTETKPCGTPSNHIEYSTRSLFKHWNGKILPAGPGIPDYDSDNPQGGELFFYSARHSSGSDLSRTSLYFNIVKKGSTLGQRCGP